MLVGNFLCSVSSITLADICTASCQEVTENLNRSIGGFPSSCCAIELGSVGGRVHPRRQPRSAESDRRAVEWSSYQEWTVMADPLVILEAYSAYKLRPDLV